MTDEWTRLTPRQRDTLAWVIENWPWPYRSSPEADMREMEAMGLVEPTTDDTWGGATRLGEQVWHVERPAWIKAHELGAAYRRSGMERPRRHAPNAGKRRGRIVRKVDPLQEKLGVELLMGDLITLDGTVYLVGGFLDGGQKVELWRESLAHAPNASDEPVPIANPDEFEDDKKLYLFTFGAYGSTKVYVWADHDEDAFEIAVEWLDDNAPGHLTDVTEDDLKRSAEDLGVEWQPSWPDWDDAAFAHVVQNAEADLTQVAHTTLKHGQYLHSWEWTFDEVTDPAEYERIAEESADEDASAQQIPNPGTFPSEAAGWRAAREPRVVRLEDGGPLLGWEIYSTAPDGSGKTFHGSERTLRAAQAWALANLNVARFDTAEPIGSGRKRRRSEP